MIRIARSYSVAARLRALGRVLAAAAVRTGGSGDPLLERLDPDDGRRLLNLPGELVCGCGSKWS
jgi:hypothetical protein